MEGEQLALARCAYEAIIDSGFEDWSSVTFAWTDDWHDPGAVMTAWHSVLEASVADFDLANDGDMLGSDEVDWKSTETRQLSEDELAERRLEIM